MTGTEILERVREAKIIARKLNLDVRVGARYVSWDNLVDYETIHAAPWMAIHDFIEKYKEVELQELVDKRNPYLKNRADGVNGHYCIARQHESGEYYEFWNSEKRIWCSAGTVIDLKTQQNR